MTQSTLAPNVLPPRLTMDEYADFLTASWRDSNPQTAARQKDLEERIVRPFQISDEKPTSTASSS